MYHQMLEYPIFRQIQFLVKQFRTYIFLAFWMHKSMPKSAPVMLELIPVG